MSPKTVAIGADHAGFELKCVVSEELARMGCEVLDLGTNDTESVDYPDYANAVAAAVSDGRAGAGVLICGTGIGMSIGANRHPGVRAALCCDEEYARLARQHNDANILVMAGRMTGDDEARKCLEVFLTTDFEGGRHARRVEKLA